TVLTLRGRDIDQACEVFVCGIAAKVTWKSHDEIEVVTPPVARDGIVDVRVVNRDDQASTLEKAFRYDAPMPPPTLLRLAPVSGTELGGLKVGLYGEDFADGVVVRFDGVEAEVRYRTGREIEVIAPKHAGPGKVTVDVTNPDGEKSALEEAFFYEPRPAPMI